MLRVTLPSLVIAWSLVATLAAQDVLPPPPAVPAASSAVPYPSLEFNQGRLAAAEEVDDGEFQEAGSPPPAPAAAGTTSSQTITPLLPLDLTPQGQIRGRIEVDATGAAQSAENKAAIGDLQNAYGFRRVRLGAQGTINDAASWVSEVELAGGNVRLRDVFIGLDAFQRVEQVRVGHFREPYSLEGMTSSNFITFMERSPLNVLSPARNWGVCGYWWPEDERLLFSFGAFRDGTGSNGQSVGDGDNWAYTVRLSGLPVFDSAEDNFRLVHLGTAFSYRVPPNGLITFAPRTGSNLLTVEDNPNSPFLPSLEILANDYELYNLQAAAVLGPLSLQSEWMAATVQQTNAGMIFVHGIYVYGSYFLTGEHRGYNLTRGSFDQVQVLRPFVKREDPQAGLGAWELAARFAYLDFDSASLPLDVNGNPASTLLYEMTLGANWYLTTNLRIMFNYTAGIPDKVGYDATVANIFGIRAALYW